MTSEEDFNRLLDANPADWQTRLIFADWLEERGDPRAEGYRAMGLWRRRPFVGAGTQCWWWRSWSPVKPTHIENALPKEWFDRIEGHDGAFFPPAGKMRGVIPRQLEDVAALAFARLPPAVRAALLAATTAAA